MGGLHMTITFKSSNSDVSESVPFIMMSYDAIFENHLKFNTYVSPLYSTSNIKGGFSANNFITSNANHLNNAQINATNRIYTSTSNNITFNGNNSITVHETNGDDFLLPNDVQLMFNPYVYSPTKIVMNLQDGVTQPKSLILYLEEYGTLYTHQISPKYFDFRFFDQNHYQRNATLGFDFVGNWENVQNFKLDIRITDENKEYLDLSGIPKNINYTVGNKLFDVNPGSSSDGIKIGNMKSYAIVAFVMAFMTFLI